MTAFEPKNPGYRAAAIAMFEDQPAMRTLGIVIVLSFSSSSTTKTTQHTLSPAVDIALGALALAIAFVVSTGHVERLAARRQNPKSRAGTQQGIDEPGTRLDEVLAVVQDQQEPSVPQRIDDARGQRAFRLLGYVQGGRQGLWNQRMVGQRRELHQPDAVLVCLLRAQRTAEQTTGDLVAEPGLPDSASAGQG